MNTVIICKLDASFTIEEIEASKMRHQTSVPKQIIVTVKSNELIVGSQRISVIKESPHDRESIGVNLILADGTESRLQIDIDGVAEHYYLTVKQQPKE